MALKRLNLTGSYAMSQATKSHMERAVVSSGLALFFARTAVSAAPAAAIAAPHSHAWA